jgi:SAM-dependent methyltransferase
MMNTELLVFTEIDSHEAYLRYREQNAEELQRRLTIERTLSAGKKPFCVPGFCYICNRHVEFRVDYSHSFEWEGELTPNYREHLSCSGCGFNNRMRASVHVLDQKLKSKGRVYITEQITPLFKLLKKRIGKVVGSEYLGSKVKFGQCDKSGTRNESITKLSFPDCSFDVIMSFDVLEHVPDYKNGFKECYRVLNPGGQIQFTIPFTGLKNNITRAEMNQNGTITHLQPAEYHGDPVKDEGCLCFHHFGWDLLDSLRTIGFVDVFALFYWSQYYGYMGKGEQMLFIASRPK